MDDTLIKSHSTGLLGFRMAAPFFVVRIRNPRVATCRREFPKVIPCRPYYSPNYSPNGAIARRRADRFWRLQRTIQVQLIAAWFRNLVTVRARTGDFPGCKPRIVFASRARTVNRFPPRSEPCPNCSMNCSTDWGTTVRGEAERHGAVSPQGCWSGDHTGAELHTWPPVRSAVVRPLPPRAVFGVRSRILPPATLLRCRPGSPDVAPTAGKTAGAASSRDLHVVRRSAQESTQLLRAGHPPHRTLSVVGFDTCPTRGSGKGALFCLSATKIRGALADGPGQG